MLSNHSSSEAVLTWILSACQPCQLAIQRPLHAVFDGNHVLDVGELVA